MNADLPAGAALVFSSSRLELPQLWAAMNARFPIAKESVAHGGGGRFAGNCTSPSSAKRPPLPLLVEASRECERSTPCRGRALTSRSRKRPGSRGPWVVDQQHSCCGARVNAAQPVSRFPSDVITKREIKGRCVDGCRGACPLRPRSCVLPAPPLPFPRRNLPFGSGRHERRERVGRGR